MAQVVSHYGDPEFDSGPVHVRFVVGKMVFGQSFFWVLEFFPVSINHTTY